MATILDEQAVSRLKQGPRSPKVKETLPAATESVLPVAMYGDVRFGQ